MRRQAMLYSICVRTRQWRWRHAPAQRLGGAQAAVNAHKRPQAPLFRLSRRKVLETVEAFNFHNYAKPVEVTNA